MTAESTVLMSFGCVVQFGCMGHDMGFELVSDSDYLALDKTLAILPQFVPRSAKRDFC